MGTFERGVGLNGATRSRCSRRRHKEVSDGSCCGARIGATILATSTPASAWRGVGVPVRLSVAHSLAARSPPDYRRAVSPLRYLLPLLSVTLLRSWLPARLEWPFLAHGLLLIQLMIAPAGGDQVCVAMAGAFTAPSV